jgi:hypothetical protein
VCVDSHSDQIMSFAKVRKEYQDINFTRDLSKKWGIALSNALINVKVYPAEGDMIIFVVENPMVLYLFLIYFLFISYFFFLFLIFFIFYFFLF